MKKLLLIAFTIAIVACKEEPKVDYAIVSGKITNKPAGDISINTFDRSFTEKLEIAPDGTFKDTIIPEQHAYVLYDGKNPVFLHLEPGYNLNISYDSQDFEKSLIISGNGSQTSNYIIAKRKNERELIGNNAETYVLNEEEFKAKFQDIKKSNENLLNSFNDLSADFKTREKRDLHYSYLAKLSEYEMAYRYFTKDQQFKVSDDFLNEFDGFDFTNEEDFKLLNNYKSLVTNHYTKAANQLATEESLERGIAFIKTVSDVKSESIKNALLYNFAANSMGYSKDIDAFYKSFLENSTNDKNNELITEKYNKLTAIAKGKPSPKFVNYENYKGGTTSLDDLKGKYVYVDVWATWCGPCKREIPFLKEVEQKYHGKNIEFVSVSIDRVSDHEKWKTMVKDKELGGIQLFADNDWNSKFVKDYQIQGIPRFILIDDQGNIVDPNAPRPSSPELEQLLNTEKI
ncbi:TlpA disulfide reductase family protein [Tamlana sp. 2201CG12-4]|uniref:TlpA family protein disulfide reductase n=1 Tax=Tamlana sp. 2201CG12-4 TaxID=3112582 RepID=UPI002DBD7821|nr:TlpA disulfide reductase family protein [Tamlana sp. 2201CG12-4]MEC3908159.1 TlpA disulfide reductase family protein [Tamlana sp. 2201CG12-4]